MAPAEAGRPMILVSMGGIPWAFENLERWRAAGVYDFVVPGGAAREERAGNLVLLPHHSPVYHPDLVAAADVLVGKLGYSTVAEALAGAAEGDVVEPGRERENLLAVLVRGRHQLAVVDASATRAACFPAVVVALLCPRTVRSEAGECRGCDDAAREQSRALQEGTTRDNR